MTALTETDNGREIELRTGQAARISLPENASTGYRWTVEAYDANMFDQPTEESHYPSGAVGSGGEIVFTFKARAPGKGRIALKNGRVWEGEAGVARRFQVTVSVAN